MAWTINGERIYVEKDTGWKIKPRLGEIEVLDSTETIIHDAGRPSYGRTLVFVVFSGYAANILPLADGTPYALVSDQGAEGDVVVMNISPDRLYDRSRGSAVYRVTMDLLKDGS